jgi:hypothetical protein
MLVSGRPQARMSPAAVFNSGSRLSEPLLPPLGSPELDPGPRDSDNAQHEQEPQFYCGAAQSIFLSL